jgi:hypothetical protein
MQSPGATIGKCDLGNAIEMDGGAAAGRHLAGEIMVLGLRARAHPSQRMGIFQVDVGFPEPLLEPLFQRISQ